MHAPTESCLSRCRCDEAWKSRPSLLVGMATSPQAIRSQTPASRPSLGLGASGTGRGLTTLTESTPAHFHAASQLLRRGRCAVARDAPRCRPWPPCRSASAPDDGSTTCRRSCAPLLSWPSRHLPRLAPTPGQGWAIAAPLQLFAPRQNATTLRLLVIFDLDRPRLRNPAPDRHAGSWTGQRHHPSRVITVPDQRRDPGPDHRHPARMTVPAPHATSVCRPAGPGFGRPRHGCHPGSPGCCRISTVARISSREPMVISA